MCFLFLFEKKKRKEKKKIVDKITSEFRSKEEEKNEQTIPIRKKNRDNNGAVVGELHREISPLQFIHPD